MSTEGPRPGAIGWWEPEARLRAEGRRCDPELTRLLDLGIALIAHVMQRTGERNGLAAWEQDFVLNANQAFNTVRAASELAFVGYPVQSLALGRLAREYHLSLAHVFATREQERRPEASDRRAGDLAREAFGDDAIGERMKVMRRALDKFAHISDYALGVPIRRDSEGRAALHLGPFVDCQVLREVGYELLATTTLVIAELIKWFGRREPRWGVAAGDFAMAAQNWLPTVRPPK